jgi:methionyl-tRNA formyltransferase
LRASRLRIVFLGLPLAALLLREDGHEIVWAGICRRKALGTRRLSRLLGPERVVATPQLDEHAATLRALSADIVVSWFWTKRVPRAVREAAPLGAIGIHPSLLPRHRGPDPYFWAIDAGDTETGVTAHVLEDEYDTGAILGQRRLPIPPSWSSWTLAKKLDRPSLALLREVVAAFARGDPPSPIVQDETLATLAPQPDDDLLELRWDDNAERIARRVRAASPFPGAFTSLDDEIVTLTRVAPTTAFPRALAAGEAAVRDDGVAVVRTADAAIELLAGRVAIADGEEEEEEEREVELDASELAALVRRAAQRAVGR